jgi:xanthine dehydrogenase accessory factor
MNQSLRDSAAAWLAAGRQGLIVEVVGFKGSVPRETGTRMLVGRETVLGTIGGGHLELKAIEAARTLLNDANNREPRTQRFPLGPALGQCCGGTVTLSYRLLDADTLADWPQNPPRFHLQLYGAGHVGRAIARLLAALDVSVDWIDEREGEFPSALLPGQPWPSQIRKLALDAVQAEVAQAPPGAFYLVLTHSHDQDLRITEAVLRRGDFGWLGLIGSKTKRAQFLRRFEQRGIAPELLSRLVCPIGVPGIVGKEPELIAIAVVAQMLQQSSTSNN